MAKGLRGGKSLSSLGHGSGESSEKKSFQFSNVYSTGVDPAIQNLKKKRGRGVCVGGGGGVRGGGVLLPNFR